MEILKIRLEEQLLIKCHDKTFTIAKNPKDDGYQRSLARMVYKVLIKWLLVVPLLFHGHRPLLRKKKSVVNNANMLNKELAGELQKPVIRNFEKRTVHSVFIDNIIFTVLILPICN